MSKRKSKSVWYLDISAKDCIENDEGHWTFIAQFTSKKKAVKFIRDEFGPCDDDGNICLITEGQL